jgi:Tol biopolymer transport system component
VDRPGSSAVALAAWLLLSAASVATAFAQTAPPQRVTLPDKHLIRPADDRLGLAISPAGDRFVYVSNRRLYLKPLAQGEPVEITGSASNEGVSSPLFTPDGQAIVYWTGAQGGTLHRINVGGGMPTTIGQAENPFGLAWGPNGALLVGQGPKGIVSFPASGGQPETIVRVSDGELAHGPHILPGGDAILYTVITEKTMLDRGWDYAQIVVQPLRGGARTVVLDQGRDGRYMPNGYLLFARDNRLFAVAFDPKSRKTTGTPVSVVNDEIHMNAFTGGAHLAVSDSGALVYLPEKSGETQFGLVGLDGTKQIIGPAINLANAPRLSPDGTKVAMSGVDEGNIWIYDLKNPAAGLHKIRTGSYYNFPVFSEDGTRIIIGADLPNGVETVYSMKPDGSGELELLARPARAPESWKQGTQTFSYITRRAPMDYDLWTFNLTDHTFEPLVHIGTSAQLSSRFSPNGKWVAYMSNETGQFEVWVEPWPATGARYRVTEQGGRAPYWSPDGSELYYDVNGTMHAVKIQGEGPQMFGERRELPITGFVPTGLRRTFDLMPDGKRFVMLFRGPVTVGAVANWTTALPTRR